MKLPHKLFEYLVLGLLFSLAICQYGCNLKNKAGGDPASGRDDLPRVLLIVGGHNYDTAEFYDMFRAMEQFKNAG